jgi:hypothetical protein
MEASRSLRGALARRRMLYRRAIFAAATGSVACVTALIACGGTTGRDGLSTPGAGDDATVDVGIQYIDRPLPDLYVAPIDTGGGGEAGAWLGCAPDIPVFEQLDEAGNVAGYEINADGSLPSTPPYEIPAVWADGGGEVPAPDGSACATAVWLGSAACDVCAKVSLGGTPGNAWYGQYGNFALLPPCSDLADAGFAVAGPGANVSRLKLCEDAFHCIVASHCFVQSSAHCFCEAGNCLTTGPDGPCATQIQSALEVEGNSTDPGATTLAIQKNFENAGLTPSDPGHGGAGLGILISVLNANCVPPTSSACVAEAGSD